MSDDELAKRRQKKEQADKLIRGKYQAGLILNCRVLAKEARGYLVSVGLHEDPGLLPTESELEVGSWIKAQFVCISNGQVLVAQRFL